MRVQLITFLTNIKGRDIILFVNNKTMIGTWHNKKKHSKETVTIGKPGRETN